MRRAVLQRSAVLLLALLPAAPVLAQEEPAKEEARRAPAAQDLRVEQSHAIELPGGETLRYRSVVETTHLLDEAGEPEAEFVSIAYERLPGDPSRPVTFAFNGGPGSASVWLHMGLLGPKLVRVPSDGEPAGAPPFPLVDNPRTLLAVSDLVFVDPIGTGFSRVVGEGKSADHWGVDEDARSVARFIRRWISDNGRWASPKYVLGESYGGIRGPLLVRELQAGFDAMALNGLILISPALDMEVVDGQTNDAAYATVLPTYAATAWYHHALPERPDDLDAFLEEARSFAREEYVPALFAGRDLPEERRDRVVQQLARFTGLSEDYIRRANLRVGTDRFRRELLRDRGLVVGRLDTRYTGTEPDAVGEVPSGDPMAAGIAGAYVAGFHHYLRSRLGVTLDRDYAVMSREAGEGWKRQTEEWPAFQGYLDVAPVLARGMADNPELRVFVANGLYDIATTFHAAETNLARSTMPLDRVVLRNYPAGHMMYVHQPTLVELSDDLLEFVRAGTGAPAVEGGAAGQGPATPPAPAPRSRHVGDPERVRPDHELAGEHRHGVLPRRGVDRDLVRRRARVGHVEPRARRVRGDVVRHRVRRVGRAQHHALARVDRDQPVGPAARQVRRVEHAPAPREPGAVRAVDVQHLDRPQREALEDVHGVAPLRGHEEPRTAEVDAEVRVVADGRAPDLLQGAAAELHDVVLRARDAVHRDVGAGVVHHHVVGLPPAARRSAGIGTVATFWSELPSITETVPSASLTTHSTSSKRSAFMWKTPAPAGTVPTRLQSSGSYATTRSFPRSPTNSRSATGSTYMGSGCISPAGSAIVCVIASVFTSITEMLPEPRLAMTTCPGSAGGAWGVVRARAGRASARIEGDSMELLRVGDGCRNRAREPRGEAEAADGPLRLAARVRDLAFARIPGCANRAPLAGGARRRVTRSAVRSRIRRSAARAPVSGGPSLARDRLRSSRRAADRERAPALGCALPPRLVAAPLARGPARAPLLRRSRRAAPQPRGDVRAEGPPADPSRPTGVEPSHRGSRQPEAVMEPRSMNGASEDALRPDSAPAPEPAAEDAPRADRARGAFSRRDVLGGGLGATALFTSGAVVMPALAGTNRAAAECSFDPDERKQKALDLRVDAAYRNFVIPPVEHPTNGDEQLYPNKIASFSKSLPHNDFGEVEEDHYAFFIEALCSGSFAALEEVPSGEPDPSKRMPFVNPLAGLAFDMEGIDAHEFRMPDPTYLPSPVPMRPYPPRFASAEQAGEMVENYWMALLRDVPFNHYGTDAVAEALDELSGLSDFRGPKVQGQVTPKTLFRERMPGTLVGPWVSQFLWKPQPFGRQRVDPMMRTQIPGQSFMTDKDSWLAIQQGTRPTLTTTFDPTRRYIRNARDMAEWVHADVLFQAYFQAALRMITPPSPNDIQNNEGGIGLPANPTNPYNGSVRQEGFGTFGPPHFITILCEVATRALKAVWFQKWFVHRRLRPEVFGGRIHYKLEGGQDYPIHEDVLDSVALERVAATFGSLFLPMSFPEGSPVHPSYGAGHGTVAGACVTMLKAFFDTQRPLLEFDYPVFASDDGLSLHPYTEPDAEAMTIEGELNKLAYNVALGRDMAGVHWRSEGIESLRLGEEVAISVLRDQRFTYAEPFEGTRFRLFNGEHFEV